MTLELNTSLSTTQTFTITLEHVAKISELSKLMNIKKSGVVRLAVDDLYKRIVLQPK